MGVFQQHGVMRFMVLQKKEPKDIQEELVATLPDNTLAYSTVQEQTALFKAGQESWMKGEWMTARY